MMYLLLRDNKQSGPYSLDELKTKGLKAYDLVWVEGRSAAWRYPSEIAELSAFAPAVEEQPFDRFFKRPAAARPNAATTNSSAPSAGVAAQPTASVAAQPVETTPPLYTNEPAAAPRKRNIYVTMPGGIAPVLREPVRDNVRDQPPFSREIAREQAQPAREAVREQPVQMPVESTREIKPARESVSREAIRKALHPSPVAAGFMEYAADPGDAAEQNGEIVPHIKPRRTARIIQPVAIGLGVVVLLAAGIVIGLSIQKDSSLARLSPGTAAANNARPIARNTAQQLPVSPVSSQAAPSQPQQQSAPATVQPGTASDRQPAQETSAASKPDNAVAVTARQSGRSARTAEVKSKAAMTGSQHPLTTAPVDSSITRQPVLQREAVHRTEVAENQPVLDKEAIRASLANQVSVGANNYQVGTFGGISNLQVTVTNRSAYSLDLVVVEVNYIQANKKIYKTETLSYRGIGAGSSLMLEAPKSSRGVQVKYKITSINSKELGLSEPGI